MRYSKRQPKILELLRRQGSCGISELAEMFGVSLETIRRDLRPLADNGHLIKLHGSVVLPGSVQEELFQKRMRENVDAKTRIARAVYELVEDGSSLMIETGSTANYIAQVLYERANLTVITNSVEIARIMARVREHRIFLAGGELRLDDGAALGNSAIEFIRQFSVKYGIISAGAVSVSGGLTNYDPLDSEFCSALLKQSKIRIAALDATKFDRETLMHVCDLSDIDVLVTDVDPDEEFGLALRSADVRLVVAGEAGTD